jgi:hypothetical protein
MPAFTPLAITLSSQTFCASTHTPTLTPTPPSLTAIPTSSCARPLATALCICTTVPQLLCLILHPLTTAHHHSGLQEVGSLEQFLKNEGVETDEDGSEDEVLCYVQSTTYSVA